MKARIPSFAELVLAGLVLAACSSWMALATGPTTSRADASVFVPAAHHRVANIGPTAPDTLRYQVTAGTVFITDLPPSLDAGPVESYAIIRAPSMSWLVDRSFFWRTATADAGTHSIRLRAEAANAPPDTLVLQIDVTPP